MLSLIGFNFSLKSCFLQPLFFTEFTLSLTPSCSCARCLISINLMELFYFNCSIHVSKNIVDVKQGVKVSSITIKVTYIYCIYIIIIIIIKIQIICYNYIVLFWKLKVLYIVRGRGISSSTTSVQHPPG